MAPPHVADSTVLGVGFVVAAWLQLAIAWLTLTRPSARIWQGSAALHLGLLGTWVVSRTAGLPFGEHAGHAESITIVDGTVVALEIVALLLAARLLLLRGSRSLALGAGIPAAALIAASVALASPDARSHAHGGHEDGGHAHAGANAELEALGFGSFMNGHEHTIAEFALDPATQAKLDGELAITREVAAQFATLQDAADAGYRRAGPYVPGLGVDLINYSGESSLNSDGVMSEEDLRHPLSLLYLSDAPDVELVGFMYYASTAEEPTGFAGRNDGWHYHESLCAVPGSSGLEFPFGPDFGATKAQCDSVGGFIIDKSGWMVHVWTAPDYDDMDATAACSRR